MKKTILACVLGLVVALPSWGATYHVRPGGTDGASGTSWSDAWKTIAKANRDARPGDIIYIHDYSPQDFAATYSDFPNPDSGGSNPSGYITFIGSSLNGDPVEDQTTRAKVRVNANDGNVLTSSYTILKGFTVAGDFATNGPRDSIISLTVTGNYVIGPDADYTFVGNTKFTGSKFEVNRPLGVTVNRCSLVALTNGDGATPSDADDNTALLFNGISTNTNLSQFVDSLYFTRNYVNITCNANDKEYSPIKLFETRKSFFKYNKFIVNNSSPDGTGKSEDWGTLVLRDSTYGNAFVADTILGIGTGEHKIFGCAPGAWPSANRAFSNRYDSLYIQVANGTPFYNPCISDRDTFRYNVFISGPVGATAYPAFDIGNLGGVGTSGKHIIDHNDFISGANSPVVRIGGTLRDTVLFYNNIVYSLQADAVRSCGTTPRTSAVEWGSPSSALFKTNWNLYSHYPRTATAGDQSIRWGSKCSGVGNGSAFEDSFPTKDSLTVYGSPQFDQGHGDSVYCASPGVSCNLLVPLLGDLSAAKGKGLSGTDIGAVATFAGYPQIQLSASQVAFAGQGLGVPDTAIVTIYNVGSADLTLGSITSSDAAVTGAFGSSTVSAGSSTDLTIIFTPMATTPTTSTLTFTTDDTQRPSVTITVYWTGAQGGGDPNPQPEPEPILNNPTQP